MDTSPEQERRPEAGAAAERKETKPGTVRDFQEEDRGDRRVPAEAYTPMPGFSSPSSRRWLAYAAAAAVALAWILL